MLLAFVFILAFKCIACTKMNCIKEGFKTDIEKHMIETFHQLINKGVRVAGQRENCH